MLSRLENMVLMGMDLPLPAIRNQIASGVDIIVHLGRIRDKSRKVLEITEVVGCENGEIRLNPLYCFEELGESSEGNVVGKLHKREACFMKGNLKRPDFRELMNPLLRTTAGILFFSWFFYRSVFAVILFIFPGILYFRKCVREQREKKRWELTVQFKECLLAVANSLRTGYAVENAFLESREDIRLLFGERSAMYGELELIRRGMIVNITLEELIGDLAERSGCEEIQQFSTILSVAKRGGGNVSQIIRNTAELISDKVETTQEMMTLLQGRRLEQRVMEVMPFAISFYIGVTYPGYFVSLYHNITGYIIMTVCLAIYLCAYIVGEKIMERIGESL